MATLAVGLGGVCPALAARLHARVVRVGFAGSGSDENTQGADHFRPGYFTPVLIELSTDAGESFTGAIEVRQSDRDGDEVVARREVMVNGVRRFYLYVPASDGNSSQPFRVRALDPSGSLLRVLDDQNQEVNEVAPSSPPAQIEGDSRVVLDISEVNRLRDLTRLQTLSRKVVVLRVSGRDLPDDPAGLEVADTIVWDGGDPEAMDLLQRQALISWVHRGGHLVLAVSRNWQQLARSKFGELLPAALSGTASMTDIDPAWNAEMFGGAAIAFQLPLTYCPVTTAALRPDAIPILPARPAGATPLLAAYRPVGRGHVVLVTAELRELLDPRRQTNLQTEVLLRKLVGLRHEEPVNPGNVPALRFDLFQFIEQRTGFQVTTQLYLLFAFLFVAGYVLVATGGCWVWLKKRRMIHHSWVAFAAVVLVASVTSLGAVHLIRGVGHRVQELTLVDAEAGSDQGMALCYFGLKTAVHTSLDLHIATRGRSVEEMPEGSTGLKPLGPNTDVLTLGGGRFRAGQRYEVLAGLGELRNVPLRATLKQFEGFWRGTLPGQLNAALKRRREGVHPDSWIQNDLGTDLRDCYLLYPSEGLGWPDRFAINIRCYRIGTLPKGKRLRLGDLKEVQAEDPVAPGSGAGANKPGPADRPSDLRDAPRAWTRAFVRRTDDFYDMNAEELKRVDLGQLNNALMTLTIFDEIERSARVQMARSQGQQIDRSLKLNNRTALLVGFSEDPGPAWLCWRTPGEARGRWRAIPSENDRRVVYRITIPIGE
ncbi:MAG: hypothetical protein AMXMBFR83_04150 [Phycisphaerae bacterium]